VFSHRVILVTLEMVVTYQLAYNLVEFAIFLCNIYEQIIM